MKIDYENDTKGVMIMRKITILFGAGAEGKGQFGLPSGKDFKRDVILAKDVELFANLFLQNAKSKIKLNKGTIISAQSSSIISPFQIQEFYKACKMIIDADDMLIIGYGVNSEDEHISNILRARLADGKRIKHFVYYKKKEEWENETTAVKAQLGYDDLLDFHSADEFGEIISKMNSCQKSF